MNTPTFTQPLLCHAWITHATVVRHASRDREEALRKRVAERKMTMKPVKDGKQQKRSALELMEDVKEDDGCCDAGYLHHVRMLILLLIC